jgi:hypothetical protein
MLRAGCILFVPNSGGQVEIVGLDERLTYDDNDAVERILSVMDSPALQRKLLDLLGTRQQLFSTQRFVAEFKAAVRRFLDNSNGRGTEEVPSR